MLNGSFFSTSITTSDVLFLLTGAGMTLLITFWAIALGTVLGGPLGLIRATAPWWINAPLGFVLDIFRSVPLLIQFILANSVNAIIGLNWPAFTIGCVVLGVNAAAFCTEIVRAGILAVPTTTRRAARSLGMTWFQDLTQIVFPIALRVAFPNWISLTLGVMKDTSLVLWIGIVELLRASQIIVTRIQEPMFVLTLVGVIYFLMGFPIARLGGWLEKKWREND